MKRAADQQVLEQSKRSRMNTEDNKDMQLIEAFIIAAFNLVSKFTEESSEYDDEDAERVQEMTESKSNTKNQILALFQELKTTLSSDCKFSTVNQGIAIFRMFISFDIGENDELDFLLGIFPDILANLENVDCGFAEFNKTYNFGRFTTEEGEDFEDFMTEVSWALNVTKNTTILNWLMAHGALLNSQLEVGECSIDKFPEHLREMHMYEMVPMMSHWAITCQSEKVKWLIEYLSTHPEEQTKYSKEIEDLVTRITGEFSDIEEYVSINMRPMYGIMNFIRYYLHLKNAKLVPAHIEYTLLSNVENAESAFKLMAENK